MTEYRDVLIVIWTWVFLSPDKARKRNLQTYWVPIPNHFSLKEMEDFADRELTKFRTNNSHIVHSSVYCKIMFQISADV